MGSVPIGDIASVEIQWMAVVVVVVVVVVFVVADSLGSALGIAEYSLGLH